MKLRLKEILKEKGKTMSEVADNIGTKQTALSRAISDDGNPTLSLLTRIAEYLEVPITDLFESAPKEGLIGIIRYNDKPYEINSIQDIKKLLAEIESVKE